MILKIIRNLIFFIGFFVTFLLGTLIILIFSFFTFNRKKIAFFISRLWAKAILFFGGIKVSIEGIENLNFDGPKVLISNHQGNFDIPILMATLPVNFRFLAKKELFDIPVFGWHLKNRGDVSIDRKNPQSATQTIMQLSKDLKYNEPILIFPEGTRSLDGKVADFKKGSIVLALQTKAKIVPIGINGSINIQKRGEILINPTKVTVRIGAPIEIVDKEQDFDKIALLLKQKVLSLI